MKIKKASLKKKFQIIFFMFCSFGFLYASIIAIYKSYLITNYINNCNIVFEKKNNEILDLTHKLILNELNKTSLLLDSYLNSIKFYSRDQNLLRIIEKNDKCDNLINKYFISEKPAENFYEVCLKKNFNNCYSLKNNNYEEINFYEKEKIEILNTFVNEEIKLYPNFLRIFNETLFEKEDENIIDQYFDKKEFMLKSESLFNISKSYIESINIDNFDFGSLYYIKFVKNLYESKLNTKPPFQLIFSFPAQKNFNEEFINFEEIFDKRHNIYFKNNNLYLFLLLNENEKLILIMNFSNPIKNFFDSSRFQITLKKQATSLSSEFQIKKTQKTKIHKIINKSYIGSNNDIFNTISIINFNVF